MKPIIISFCVLYIVFKFHVYHKWFGIKTIIISYLITVEQTTYGYVIDKMFSMNEVSIKKKPYVWIDTSTKDTT
jgi:hypothetical protein